MGKAEREKGHRFERSISKAFREAMPGALVKRGIQSQVGGSVPDVEVPLFWPECKTGKAPPVWKALEYAEQNAPEGRIPIAICKKDRKRTVVMLPLQEFLQFVQEWWELKQEKEAQS